MDNINNINNINNNNYNRNSISSISSKSSNNSSSNNENSIDYDSPASSSIPSVSPNLNSPKPFIVPISEINDDEQELSVFDEKRKNKIPITITINNLNVQLKNNSNSIFSKIGLSKEKPKKSLLKNINAIVKPGELCAILGGSGSGKTTLLNTLSGRYLKSEMKVKGDICFNNFKPSPTLINKTVAYVMQKDYPLPNLTVRETLQFNALLRLPISVSKEEKLKRVESIINELCLRDCANTRVGGAGKSHGISGGEKRRLSVGCQLLTDPSVLFLDEVTSGLDSTIAYELIKTLSKIARIQNRTIITTIHQPRADIFKIFDRVMLLSKGRLVYNGPSNEMTEYFTTIGYPCPRLENPADFFIDICSVDYRNQVLENESTLRLDQLVNSFQISESFSNLKRSIQEVSSKNLAELSKLNLEVQDSNNNSNDNNDNNNENDNNSNNKNDEVYLSKYELKSQLRESKPFYYTIPILSKRAYINHLRDVEAAITRVSQVVSFAIMLALCFLRIDRDQFGIQNTVGFLYQSLSLIFVALLSCIALFPTERNLFYRERSDGLYSSLSFFLSYMTLEIPFNIFGSLGFSIITYFALGLKLEVGSFFIFFMVVFLLTFSGESVGLFVCSMFYNINLATTIANITLCLFSILSGFFRPTNQMPSIIRYFNYALPTKWASEVYSANELRGRTFNCPDSQSLDGNGTICPTSTGEEVLAKYSWEDVDIGNSLGVMIALSIIYRIIVFIALKYNRKNVVQ